MGHCCKTMPPGCTLINGTVFRNNVYTTYVLFSPPCSSAGTKRHPPPPPQKKRFYSCKAQRQDQNVSIAASCIISMQYLHCNDYSHKKMTRPKKSRWKLKFLRAVLPWELTILFKLKNSTKYLHHFKTSEAAGSPVKPLPPCIGLQVCIKQPESKFVDPEMWLRYTHKRYEVCFLI